MPEPALPIEKTLEADLARLAAEIKNQRERPEMKNSGEKELIKEAIRAFPRMEKDLGSAPVPPPPAAGGGGTSASPLPDYAQNAPAEVKLEIEYLLDVALRGGLHKAFLEAQKSPYFVQDAFHDALAGKLYPELKKRGIVK